MFRPALLAALVAFAVAGQVTDESQIDAILKAHNDERASFGMPPAEWDANLAQLAAHQSALGCATFGAGHDKDFIAANGDFGQNIATGASTGPVGPAVDLAKGAVADWISEKSRGSGDYTHCAFDHSSQTTCGHFTQVIWKTSTKIGCAMDTECQDGSWNSWSFTCNYLAAGNMAGQAPLTATNVGGGSGSGGGASAPSAPAPSAGAPAPSGYIDCDNLDFGEFSTYEEMMAFIEMVQAACPDVSIMAA